MGGRTGAQDIHEKSGQKSPMAVRSIFEEQRVQLNQSCKEERFGSLYHALLMCEMIYPSKSRSVRLACAGSMKGKYEIQNHKSENKDQRIAPNPNEILQREGDSEKNMEHINCQVECV